MRVAFRCDGDERIGAGHVARCLGIGRALVIAGHEPVFVGRFGGLAAALLADAGMPAVAPSAGAPSGSDAVVVDSYALPALEIEALARRVPLACVSDGEAVPQCSAVLDYHLDANGAWASGAETPILGPAYAPVDPRCAAARRTRGFERLLVTLGGSDQAALRDRVANAVLAIGDGEIAVAPSDNGPVSLAERLDWPDAAVSGAGFTAYELACAGVPALLVPVAPNQARVAAAFAAAELALVDEELNRGLRRLGDTGVRERLAERGPSVFDGYGAFRARDALLAAFAGRPLPRVIRYRPARAADSALLLAWRNDPATVAGTRTQAPVSPGEHARWLARVLADAATILLVAETENRPVANVRLDLGAEEAEISITVAPRERGRGLAGTILRQAAELALASRPSLDRVVADVRRENVASLSAAERAGFRIAASGPAGRFVRLTLGRDDLRSSIRTS